MKYIFNLFLALLVASSFAQSKPQVNSAKSTPFPLTAKDSLLCKAWKLKSVEEFSVKNEPNEKQKNDGVTFMLDRTAFVTIEGNTKTGTWSTDAAKTRIMVNVDGEVKETIKLKIEKLEKEELILKYQDPELITSIYIYSAKK